MCSKAGEAERQGHPLPASLHTTGARPRGAGACKCGLFAHSTSRCPLALAPSLSQAVANSAPKGQVEVTFPQKGNKVVIAKQGEPIGKVVQRAGMRVKFDCKVCPRPARPWSSPNLERVPCARRALVLEGRGALPTREVTVDPAYVRTEWPLWHVPGPSEWSRGGQGLPGCDHSWWCYS